jgi:hypothetical protein
MMKRIGFQLKVMADLIKPKVSGKVSLPQTVNTILIAFFLFKLLVNNLF